MRQLKTQQQQQQQQKNLVSCEYYRSSEVAVVVQLVTIHQPPAIKYKYMPYILNSLLLPATHFCH